MDAPKAASPVNGAAEESQESIYARNRAIYEASLAQQQQQASNGLNGGSNDNNTTGTSTPSEKQARPREEDDAPPRSPEGTSQQPAKKKLIRAGDRAAAAGTTGSDAGLPSLAPTTGTPEPQSAASATGAPAGESMREKIARASRSASGTPFVAQVQYSPPPASQQALPPSSAATAVNPAAGLTNNLEQAIEVNALAFIAKNPQIDPNHVRQALKHSQGRFDQNFNTAIQLLMSSSSSSQQHKQASPSLAQGGFQQPAPSGGIAGHRYPGQQINPTPPPSQGHFPGQVPNGSAPAPRNYPGSKMSPPAAPQALHPHQMTGPPGSRTAGSPSLVGNQASIINGQSAAALQPQPGAVSAIPMPSAPNPPVMVGTHPAIGFSALQILPQSQHAQYYQLAPNQQTDYSMQVFKSLPAEQQKELTAEWSRSEALRQQWNLYYAQNPQSAPHHPALGQVVIPPRGTPNNPYVPYAAQQPTDRQQMVQQRFPGQNPVFRVGNNAQGGQQAPGQQMNPQAQMIQQQHHQGQQGSMPPHQGQYTWFHKEQSRLLSEMSPEARQKFHELSPADQYHYVVQSVQLKQENAKRIAQQSQRQQQQKVMAATAKAARSGQHPSRQHAAAQQAAAAAAAAGGQKKKKKKNAHDSDDSEALGLHDEDTDDDRGDDDVDGDDGSEAEAEREAAALVWFNTAKPEELMEMTGEFARISLVRTTTKR